MFYCVGLKLAAPLTAYFEAVAAAKSMQAVIQRESKINSLLDTGMIPASDAITSTCSEQQARGCIQFHDVSFAYPSKPDAPIFSSLCLKIEAGLVTALVGSSGSGKVREIDRCQYVANDVL